MCNVSRPWHSLLVICHRFVRAARSCKTRHRLHLRGCGRRKTMKRSELNAIMRDADQFIRQRGFYLPPFAYWTPAEWSNKGEEAREIVENQLGWDITDFGGSRFNTLG